MFGRDRMPHRPLPDEIHGYRDGPSPPISHRRGPPPPHHIEEELAVGHDKIRRLIADNRLLVEENIAMKRELDVAREDLHAICQAIPKIRAEKEAKARELIQMGLKLEAEIRALEPIKVEAVELKAEARKLDGLRQEMNVKIQSMSKDLKNMQAENKQIPKMRMELDGLHQELVRIRTGYEYEQKARGEQMEQKQALEKNLISMTREIEKLRAEQENLDMRALGGPGLGAYGTDLGYPSSFSENYGREKGNYGAGSWGSYEARGGYPRH